MLRCCIPSGLFLVANSIVLSCHLSSKHARSCLGKLGTYIQRVSDHEAFVPIDLTKCLWTFSKAMRNTGARNNHSFGNACQPLKRSYKFLCILHKNDVQNTNITNCSTPELQAPKKKKKCTQYARANTIPIPPIQRPIDDIVRHRRSCCPGAGTPAPAPPPPRRHRRRR